VPEYNNRVSAVLKNAYDWISMAPNPKEKPSPVGGKVAGMIGSGANGADQAQAHLVQIVQYCKVKLFRDTKVEIKRYEPGTFDEHGHLTSETAKKTLDSYLKDFAKFISKNK
jgi:NAD(P)H-dependent FMN reductase